jgi:hypothetical protein
MHFPLSFFSPAQELPGTAPLRRFQVASHPPVAALQCSVTSWQLYMSYGAHLKRADERKIPERRNGEPIPM